MAVDLCSENCGVSSSSVSPRISFSHDFSQSDIIPVEQLPFRSNSSGLNNSTIDFDFCVSESFELEASSADELFSQGRILPTEVKRKSVPTKQTSGQLAPKSLLPPPHHAAATTPKKKESPNKETKNLHDEVYEKQSSKSFWSFKRSSSCGIGHTRSFCPLPLLSRSNSTGSSTPSVKRNSISKEGVSANNIKPNSQKHSSSTRLTHSHSFVPNGYHHQKPPLNYKNHHGSYGNSVRVNPVLNVPPANLFGLASIFSNNRDKNKRQF
ncbi:hypothetical protein Fmac_017089 [Flemingia macrophylla]|uniref:Uncharacterized protein n=1 Tax=Flemingia macrophylla TaxID=520843 RepID=A0ABD1M1S9_9FABA